MGKSGNFDTGTGELAPRASEFLAGVLALSRISRVTVALESGHGAGPALSSAARLTAHAETCVYFDGWRGDPLAALAANLFDAEPAPGPCAGAGESVALGLRTLQARERRSFLVIFDRFDEYLAQPADQPHVAAFDRAFVEMASDSELDVHFLLVMDEAAEPLLARFQNDIPGIGDGCLRMPAGGIADNQKEAPAPDSSRASRRDRSFGMLLERLTTVPPVAPAGAAAASRPDDVRPVMDIRAPVSGQPADQAMPDHHYQPVVDATAINEAAPVRHEPIFAMPEPAFAPLPAESGNTPAASVAAAQAVEPTMQDSVPPAPSTRRGKALTAIMATVMAVGAGLYAYKQRPPAPAAVPPAATATATATATAANPVAESGAAAPAVAGAEAQQAASPPPVPQPAPALAAATAVPATPAPAKPAAKTAPNPAVAATPPTVYVHVRSQRERDRMQALARTLSGKGIRVVDVKVMNKGPSVADLRYFRDQDKETAVTVQKAMVAAGVPITRLSRMNGYEGSTRPGHFEAWLGGDKAAEPVRRR